METEYEIENPPENTPTEESARPMIPKPGDVIACDFRPTPVASGTGDLADARPDAGEESPRITTLKVMTWNIHRGYKIKSIIKEIAAVNPDILFLQEVDMNCDRTDAEDIGGEIARALGYNLVYACEFEEVYSPARKPEDQGGGTSGSCVLSKFEHTLVRGIVHKVKPVDWEFPGPIPGEPRRGLHITPFVTVKTPLGLIGCYCVHLEEYCGIEARLEQFMEIIEDASLHTDMPLIVAGDFNTKAHGMARLSPWYCGDWMRLGTLGYDESEVWEDMLWNDLELNPGFFDPFDDEIVTFSDHKGWLKAKCDHIRLRGLRFTDPTVGGRLTDLGEEGALSTHRYLYVTVSPDPHSVAHPENETAATAALLQNDGGDATDGDEGDNAEDKV